MFCPITLKDIQYIKKQTGHNPFYYYDGNMIEENCKKFLSSFRKYFRDFRNFYKVRDLHNPIILDNLFKWGMDFDVTTQSEFETLNNLGILPGHITFTNNFTSKECMEYIYNNQININLDNITDLDIFDKSRIKFDNKVIIHDNIICFNYNSDVKNNKFGMSSDDIIKGFIKASEMGYNIFGIKCTEYNTNYDDLFQNLFSIIDKLRKEKIIIDFINLGEIFDITDETPQNLRKIFDKYIEIYELDDEPKIYAECTSHITKNYGWLITECVSIKKNNSENQENIETTYGLNANLTNLFKKVNDENNISVFGKKSDDKIIANIVGNTYNYNDVFATNITIPEINIDDTVIIHNVGINNSIYNEYMKYKQNIQTITKKNTYDNDDYIIWIINFIIIFCGVVLYFLI